MLQKLRSQISRLNLAAKISFLFILVLVTITMLFGLITYHVSTSVAYQMSTQQTVNSLESVAQILDRSFASIETTVSQLYSASFLQSAIAMDNGSNPDTVLYNKVNSEVRNIVEVNAFVKNIWSVVK